MYTQHVGGANGPSHHTLHTSNIHLESFHTLDMQVGETLPSSRPLHHTTYFPRTLGTISPGNVHNSASTTISLIPPVTH